MRAIILLSLLFAQATFGAVANYRTWMTSWNWNPMDLVALLDLNSMITQKQVGDFHKVTDAFVSPTKASDLRRQGAAYDIAVAHGFSYGLGPQPGPICIKETPLPQGSEAISDAYLVADHIFELQFAAGILNKQNVDLDQVTGPDTVEDFLSAINSGPNMAMISSELNCYKAVVMRRTIAAVLNDPSTCPPYEATQPSNVELTAYMSFACHRLLGAAEAVDTVIRRKKKRRVDERNSEKARFALQSLLKCIGVELDRFADPGDEEEEPNVQWTCMNQVPAC